MGAAALRSRDPDVAAVRGALRGFLRTAADTGGLPDEEFAVACSGGPDSLALAALAVPLAAEARLRLRAFVVDHRLQPGSDEVANATVRRLADLGAPAQVLPVTVAGGGGMEAAARRARYSALRQAARPGELVLLGHTRDDQAETVLLGLARGSGPRSIAGMRPLDPPWGRPLLTVSRAQTVATCRALGLQAWRDPHNHDPRFTRVRLRQEVLPLLEQVLAGGVAAALARTAGQLREDLDLLDTLAGDLHTRAAVVAECGSSSNEVPKSHTQDALVHKSHMQHDLLVAALEPEPAAMRRRVLRRWLMDAGVRELTEEHLRSVDALIGSWRGQGGVWVPGGLVVGRTHGRLCVSTPN